MSRTYIELVCGCLVSCDSGGGLVPCSSDKCKFKEWSEKHQLCSWCGDCLTCYNHGGCEDDINAMVQKENNVITSCNTGNS